LKQWAETNNTRNNMKTKAEVQDMADRAVEAVNDPLFSGLTYEEGVRIALDWVLDKLGEETPLD
jgi:hypothetical protein